MSDPVYQENQIVCVLVRGDRSGVSDGWYFGKIAKIHPKKPDRNEDAMAEVNLYDVPETFDFPENEVRFEHLYPGVSLLPETVMLTRLGVRMSPRDTNQYIKRVHVHLKDLCAARGDHFLRRVISR